MEKNGSLKVDRYLQVEEIKDVFAIGDCNNTLVLKLAYIAGMQAGKLILFSDHTIILSKEFIKRHKESEK